MEIKRTHNIRGPWENMDPEYGNQEEIMDSIVNGTSHELFRNWRDKYGNVFIFYEKSAKTEKLHAKLVIGDPDIARKFVLEFNEKIPAYKDIHVLGPCGILSTDDNILWEKQRRLLSPLLSHMSIIKKSDVIEKTLFDMFDHPEFIDAVKNNISIDLYPLIINTTFRMLVHTLFGQINMMDSEIDEIREAIDICVFKGVMSIPFDDPEHKEAIDIVDNFINKIKKTAIIQKDTVYEAIMQKDNNDRYVFTEKEQNNIITTFLFAGHETTAKTIFWTLIEIARNTDIKKKLQKEINDANKELSLIDDNSKIYHKLTNLKYMTKIINESMRKWPVVAGGTFRHIPKEMTILGDKFYEGDAIYINIDLAHNDKNVWINPDQFDPDRKKCPVNFYPFSLPNRDCLGKNMALLEIRIFLFHMFQKFDIHLDNPDQEISGYYVGTMKPKQEVLFKIETFNKSNILSKL